MKETKKQRKQKIRKTKKSKKSKQKGGFESRIFNDMMEKINKEGIENAILIILVGIAGNTQATLSRLIRKLFLFDTPQKIYFLGFDGVLPYESYRSKIDEFIQNIKTDFISIFNDSNTDSFNLDRINDYESSENNIALSIGFIKENIPTEYENLSHVYRKIANTTKNLSYLTEYNETVKKRINNAISSKPQLKQIFPDYRACIPNETFPFNPYKQTIIDLIDRNGKVIVDDDAWWFENNSYFSNIYFELMCELLYFFNNLERNPNIYIIWPIPEDHHSLYSQIQYPISNLVDFTFNYNPTFELYTLYKRFEKKSTWNIIDPGVRKTLDYFKSRQLSDFIKIDDDRYSPFYKKHYKDLKHELTTSLFYNLKTYNVRFRDLPSIYKYLIDLKINDKIVFNMDSEHGMSIQKLMIMYNQTDIDDESDDGGNYENNIYYFKVIRTT